MRCPSSVFDNFLTLVISAAVAAAQWFSHWSFILVRKLLQVSEAPAVIQLVHQSQHVVQAGPLCPVATVFAVLFHLDFSFIQLL